MARWEEIIESITKCLRHLLSASKCFLSNCTEVALRRKKAHSLLTEISSDLSSLSSLTRHSGGVLFTTDKVS